MSKRALLTVLFLVGTVHAQTPPAPTEVYASVVDVRRQNGVYTLTFDKGTKRGVQPGWSVTLLDRNGQPVLGVTLPIQNLTAKECQAQASGWQGAMVQLWFKVLRLTKVAIKP